MADHMAAEHPDSTSELSELLRRLNGPEANDAWEQLIAQLGPEVERICLAIVGPDMAADCMQNAFLGIQQSAEQYIGGGPQPDQRARAWVRRIAINSAKAMLRSQRRRQRRFPLSLEQTDLSFGHTEKTDSESLSDQAGTRLHTELQRLNDNERALLRAYYYENVGVDYLSQQLGCSPEAVRKRLQRCLNKLRRRMRLPAGVMILSALSQELAAEEHWLPDQNQEALTAITVKPWLLQGSLAAIALLGLLAWAHPGADGSHAKVNLVTHTTIQDRSDRSSTAQKLQQTTPSNQQNLTIPEHATVHRQVLSAWNLPGRIAQVDGMSATRSSIHILDSQNTCIWTLPVDGRSGSLLGAPTAQVIALPSGHSLTGLASSRDHSEHSFWSFCQRQQQLILIRKGHVQQAFPIARYWQNRHFHGLTRLGSKIYLLGSQLHNWEHVSPTPTTLFCFDDSDGHLHNATAVSRQFKHDDDALCAVGGAIRLPYSLDEVVCTETRHTGAHSHYNISLPIFDYAIAEKLGMFGGGCVNLGNNLRKGWQRDLFIGWQADEGRWVAHCILHKWHTKRR